MTRVFKLTRPEPAERIVLASVLEALALHPKVAWAVRMNTAAGKLAYRNGETSQWMRFGFVGAADITGQLKDGRRLEVEVKRPSGRVRPEQAAFLERVNEANGVGFVARSVEDVWEVLGK
jgi:hypothetical protein